MASTGKLNDPKPLQIHFDDAKVDAMLTLLKLSPFPTKPPLPASKPWDLGVDVDWIAGVKARFEERFGGGGARRLEEKVNRYRNYVVKMREEESGVEVDVHFVHARSKRGDAIPLMMLHGWPGTFLDFHKVIEPLINPPDGEPAFHVVTPSLPGYFLSSLPQLQSWTLERTARVFHRLMHEVLGYEKYAVQGGDWGSVITRILGSKFPSFAPAIHFNMFPKTTRTTPADVEHVQKAGTPAEKRQLEREAEVFATGIGYFQVQATKPFTIGLSLASSPLSLLIYIGEKFYAWSDPRYLDADDLIDTVALYYLSGCFAGSVVVYSQKRHIKDDDEMLIGSKIGYSAFPYELVSGTRAQITAVGPLVYYKEREKGGHFAALDNPVELVEDLREFFGEHFPRKSESQAKSSGTMRSSAL